MDTGDKASQADEGRRSSEWLGLAPKRPDCFDFAMDFLGGPEDALVIEYVEKLEAGWVAACAFIDAHIGDPDMTQRMRDTYAEFQKWRGILKA